MKLLKDPIKINSRVFPGKQSSPVVFTIELPPNLSIHNVTEEIALLINNFAEFDGASIKQLVEIIPVGKMIT